MRCALFASAALVVLACSHDNRASLPTGDHRDLMAPGESLEPRKADTTLEDSRERDDSEATAEPEAKAEPAVSVAASQDNSPCERIVAHTLKLAADSADLLMEVEPEIAWNDPARAREQLLALCEELDLPAAWQDCVLAATSVDDLLECGDPNVD